MAVRIKGVLPLLRDFDPSTLSKVKHSITKTTGSDSVKTQVTIPQLSIGASQMEPLSFLSDFKRSATIVKWKTGPLLFEKFPMDLQAIHLDTWNLLSANSSQTVPGFTACVDSIKHFKFLDDSYEKQFEFPWLIKKPKNLQPITFSVLLSSYHNALIPELPGAPSYPAEAMFSNAELKCLFLHSMPITWQNKFEDVSKTTHNSTLIEIVDYMYRQAEKIR
jgi:hypothetical protein